MQQCELLKVEEEGKKVGQRCSMRKVHLFLLALKKEEEGHKPENAAASSRRYPSGYSQQGNRDCNPIAPRK